MDPLDIFKASEAELQEAWNHFCATHTQPSRLFRLAQRMVPPTDDDTNHLEECESCRKAYLVYKEPPCPN